MVTEASEESGTPLDEEERAALLLPVQNRDELNLVERDNVSKALLWVYRSPRRRPEIIVSERWLKDLHRRMYDEVWQWAGQYRRTDKNIGVSKRQIATEMRYHLDNVMAWLGNQTDTRFSEDELSIRFGHRLVAIHPFPNGNGRWHRLASDALILALGGRPFTWGGKEITDQRLMRKEYITALRLADEEQDFSALLAFARKD